MHKKQEFFTAKQSFDIYYNNEIRPKLEELEKTRKKYLKVFCMLCIFVTSWIVYIIKNFKNLENLPQGIEFISCILVLIACLPMLSYYIKTKSSLLYLLANFFGEFSYNYNYQNQENILEKSKIFDKNNIMKTDDEFCGTYKNVSLCIREYTLYKRVNNQTGTNNYFANEVINKSNKMYNGIIFYASMNKKFKGQTIIVKDKGFLNKLVSYNKLKRVGLESTEFEKSYEVYSDDQIEARFLLTSVMLEYLIKLKRKFNKIELSFFDNHVFINIKTKKNMFECSSFFTTIINKKRIEKVFEELYLIISIVDTLRINQDKY